jgi:hypothetical protein
MTGFDADRRVAKGVYSLREVFAGLDESPGLVEVLPDAEVRRVFLDAALVSVDAGRGFMWVSDEDGVLHVSHHYLETGDLRTLYLDVVHELTHVKQFHEGRELFDEAYEYVDRPTEIEAYAVAVREAQRLGMSTEEILEYLEVPWISPEEHARLAEAVGLPPVTPDVTPSPEAGQAL